MMFTSGSSSSPLPDLPYIYLEIIMKTETHNSQTRTISAESEALMTKLGITRSSDKQFHIGSHHYATLDEAVSQAKRQTGDADAKSKKTESVSGQNKQQGAKADSRQATADTPRSQLNPDESGKADGKKEPVRS
jgi:hypothetical protein